MSTDFENTFHKEPVTFLLSNALRHLTLDQQRELCNALLERLPVPASLEQEAERLYPDTKENETVSMGHNGIQDLRRSAHITAARQYMGEIETLTTRVKELEEHLKGIYEMYGDEWSNYAQEWTEKVLKIKPTTP